MRPRLDGIVTTQTSSSSSSGLGFAGALTILFIALKLLGKISWSWWWVLSPLWIGWAIILSIMLICVIIAAIVS